jgi:hypothetical protein
MKMVVFPVAGSDYESSIFVPVQDTGKLRNVRKI